MIVSPLARPLANHFERSGSSGFSAPKAGRTLSAAELAYQDLQGGDYSLFGAYENKLFLYTGEDENGNCIETVIDLSSKPETAAVQTNHPAIRTATPESKIPSFLIPEPASA